MNKLLLVFVLIAVVASADFNQELNALVDDIKLNGVDWGTVLAYVKKIGCAAGAPVCCAFSSKWCSTCKAVVSAVC